MTPTLTVFAGLGAISVGLILSGWQLLRASQSLPVRARTLPRIDLPETVARRFVERLVNNDVSELAEPMLALSARWNKRLDAWTLQINGGKPRTYHNGERTLEILERDVVAHICDGRRQERNAEAERLERDWRGGR